MEAAKDNDSDKLKMDRKTLNLLMRAKIDGEYIFEPEASGRAKIAGRGFLIIPDDFLFVRTKGIKVKDNII